jgi:hypothetical protein
MAVFVPNKPTAPYGCTYDGPEAATSTRVKDLVNTTGGVLDDICTLNIVRTFKSAVLTGDVQTSFGLTAQALDPEAIVVEVDGAPVDRIGPGGDVRWSYAFFDNRLAFEPAFTPPSGSTVTVSYTVCP